MANEAQLRLKLENSCPFTVADGTGIEKGSLLKVTDPRTAIIASGTGDALAGIAMREKVADSGRTELGVYRRGWFDMYVSGAVTVGQAVCSISGFPNYVMAAGETVSGAAILGTALETGSNGEQILIDVNVGAGGNHSS